jgi:hypothetical protein
MSMLKKAVLFRVGLCWVLLQDALAAEAATGGDIGAGPQYSTAHVYVSNADLDAFVHSIVATFGGKASRRTVITITPTQSRTASQYILTPYGMLSVFAFQTPIPYPFGSERTGYLVHDLGAAVSQALDAGADLTVAPFDDPIGKDAVIAWPGGVQMQLYWHAQPAVYPPLKKVPDNRIYLSPHSAGSFLAGFLKFSGGQVLSDDAQADGAEIDRPDYRFRKVRIASSFGNLALFVTDGKLPYPFGRENIGYAVDNVSATLARAQRTGARVLSPPKHVGTGSSAMVIFPGGYIAEVHDGQ